MLVNELFKVLDMYTICEIRTILGKVVYKGFSTDIPDEYMEQLISSIEPIILFSINDKGEVDNSLSIRINIYYMCAC